MAYVKGQPFKPQFDDGSGNLLSGGTIEFQNWDTSTATNFYTDSIGTSGGKSLTLNSRGEPPSDIFFDDGISYKLILKDSSGTTVSTLGPYQAVSSTSLVADASGITYTPAGIGAVDTTVQAKLRESVSVKDYGAQCDGVTDDTSTILSVAANNNYLYLPYNTKYDPQTLLATLPTDVVIFDASMINSFNSAGETTKEVGLISKDTAASDTHWLIASDHHAILQLSNFGGAGTTSASQRKGSMVWTAGKFENASATNKNGWRGGAIKQFTKESSGSYWIETLRCLAPWAAIGGDYERWKTGESVSSGDYRTNDDQHYVAASTGTTGATGPTHTTGTVSDGGVDWTWIDTADRTIYQIDEYGRFLIGTGTAGSTFRHKVGLTDPVGDYVGQFAARGLSKNVRHAFYPTDGSGNEELQPYLLAQAGVGLRILSSTGTEIARFNDDLGTYLKENARSWTMVSDGDTTPSVDGVATIYTQNTGATSITAFDDGDDGQVVDLVIIDANTTLVHSSTFMLAGSVNLTTPAAYTTVTFQKVPSSISNRWIEIGRSEK